MGLTLDIFLGAQMGNLQISHIVLVVDANLDIKTATCRNKKLANRVDTPGKNRTGELGS